MKIGDLLHLNETQMLTVNPEYQRGSVWAEAQQKRLIDSVLRGYPLPLIYLHYKKVMVSGMTRESLEIIDGQQRIKALNAFAQGGLKLYDPIKDDKKARFPEFIKKMPCPWAQCDYLALPQDFKEKFNNTQIFIVKVTTDNEDEARDLFIRLQAGLPLNAQEKRDAWPGGFTEFTLRFGGKREIPRYPGHDFFRKHISNKSTDRGELRTLCAQIGMLYFSNATEGHWLDLGTSAIDDYYYQQLGFDNNSLQVQKLSKIFDLACSLLDGYVGPKLQGNEAIHLILFIDSLVDDYTKDWYKNFVHAFDKFRHNVAIDKRRKEGDYWFQFVALTRTSSASAMTVQKRHTFFTTQMLELLKPLKKDEIRGYGHLEREIIYYRDQKNCAVCGFDISWEDLEIHHIEEHQFGGLTTMENGVAVHKACHPKGSAALEFRENWKLRQELVIQKEIEKQSISFDNLKSSHLFKLENINKGIVAYGRETDDKKFCVLKGSNVSPTVSENFAASNPIPKNKRIKYYREGIIDSENTFTCDVIFNTKSGAASLILGQSANGNLLWVPQFAKND